MIFVTVGSSQFSFERLLRAVDELGVDEELVVQHGPSTVRPRGARCAAFLSFDEVAAHAREARLVVSHAGIGSVLTALAAGKRPIVVPRRRRFGETTDDHQVETARRLAQAGLVAALEDPSDLAAALRDAGAAVPAPPRYGGRLVQELKEYVRASVADRAVGAAL
jgi:beta-1,4-N-acetylglucosaminyltransferase